MSNQPGNSPTVDDLLNAVLGAVPPGTPFVGASGVITIPGNSGIIAVPSGWKWGDELQGHLHKPVAEVKLSVAQRMTIIRRFKRDLGKRRWKCETAVRKWIEDIKPHAELLEDYFSSEPGKEAELAELNKHLGKIKSKMNYLLKGHK